MNHVIHTYAQSPYISTAILTGADSQRFMLILTSNLPLHHFDYAVRDRIDEVCAVVLVHVWLLICFLEASSCHVIRPFRSPRHAIPQCIEFPRPGADEREQMLRMFFDRYITSHKLTWRCVRAVRTFGAREHPLTHAHYAGKSSRELSPL